MAADSLNDAPNAGALMVFMKIAYKASSKSSKPWSRQNSPHILVLKENMLKTYPWKEQKLENKHWNFLLTECMYRYPPDDQLLH